MCIRYMYGPSEVRKGVGSHGTGLVNYHMDVGNLRPVVCKSSKCSEYLSQPSSTNILLDYIYLMYVLCLPVIAAALTWRSEDNLEEVVLAFYPVGSLDP